MLFLDSILNLFLKTIKMEQIEKEVIFKKFDPQKKKIKLLTHLLVGERQLAVITDEGEIKAILEPGVYKLSFLEPDKSDNDPFHGEIIFFSMQHFVDQRWGTPTPITFEDSSLGSISIRAHGTYTFRLKNPKTFLRKFKTGEEVSSVNNLSGQLRSIILTEFADFLGNSGIEFTEMASNQLYFSQALQKNLTPIFAQFGLFLENILIQSISMLEQNDSNSDAFEELEKLQALLGKGIITKEEFDVKKAKLLSRI